MAETVLLIDGRGRPRALARCLERLGARCLHARGPLKARSILAGQPVALIVWREDPRNPGLSDDLCQAWSEFPRVPVVHLFPDRGHAAHRAHPQIVAALPWAGFQESLPPLVAPLLDGRPLQVPRPLAPQSELAFRNVWGQFRQDNGAGIAPPGLGDAAAHYAAATSVNPSERQHLADALGAAGVPARKSAAGWWPFRRR